jgi:hypothetical protein
MFQVRDTHETRNGGETELEKLVYFVVEPYVERRKKGGAFPRRRLAPQRRLV